MKTDIRIQPDGTVYLTTQNRGESTLQWLDRLKGKKLLEIASGPPERDHPKY